MRCVYCGQEDANVIDTTHDARGGIRRRRECLACHQRFTTYERPIFSTPLVVKHDGTREEFDREKLSRGIRIACAKRPVPASEIDRIVGEVEASLQQMNKPEISSRVIGDYGDFRPEGTGSHRVHPLRHRLSSLRRSPFDPRRN